MPGGGNHRGSIFRLHVGTALLGIGLCPEAAATWGQGGSATPEVRRIEYPLEQAVSDHIGAMPFLWLAVATHRAPTVTEGSSRPAPSPS